MIHDVITDMQIAVRDSFLSGRIGLDRIHFPEDFGQLLFVGTIDEAVEKAKKAVEEY
jgi:hypothetical protein